MTNKLVGYVPQSVIDWLSSDERTHSAYSSINLYKNPCGSSDVPLYAAPVRTKDLTDDEIATVYEQDEHHHGEFNYRFDPVSFARAVIAADREKNK